MDIHEFFELLILSAVFIFAVYLAVGRLSSVVMTERGRDLLASLDAYMPVRIKRLIGIAGAEQA